jgi:hypothetical protein
MRINLNKVINNYCDIFQCHPDECKDFRKRLELMDTFSEGVVREQEAEGLWSAGEADAIIWELT